MSGEIKSKKYTGVYHRILKNKDKCYYITYKDLEGKKIWLKVGRHSEGIREPYCYQKRNEIVSQIKTGDEQTVIINRRIKRNEVKLDEVALEYHNSRRLRSKEKSVKDSISRYERYIKPIFGNKSLNDIKKSEVEKMMRDLKGKLSNSTINNIKEKLSTIINFAINSDEIKYDKANPVSKIHNLKTDDKRERYLSKDEIQFLISELNPNSLIYIFTKLALTTGGRLETILNIKKIDLNFSDKTINLYDFKNETNYKAFIQKNFEEELFNFVKDKKNNEYIFPKDIDITKKIQRDLKPILDTNFNQGLDINDRKNRVVIHTFRHTFASQLAINGTPIFTIQKLMNHKDISMTMRYAKLAPDSGRENVDSLF
ncbi:tyrosine-type recombinase/integrase [Arcobacter sp. YIC-80]|uniref:tyrosine-type recombinase/integrase n=1 Tax=Arcobacter sp. YIC-80 TaxID=3376683 RepID=UPI00384BB517